LKVDNTWSLMPFNVDEQLGEEVHLMPENMDSILDQVLNISQKKAVIIVLTSGANNFLEIGKFKGHSSSDYHQSL